MPLYLENGVLYSINSSLKTELCVVFASVSAIRVHETERTCQQVAFLEAFAWRGVCTVIWGLTGLGGAEELWCRGGPLLAGRGALKDRTLEISAGTSEQL